MESQLNSTATDAAMRELVSSASTGDIINTVTQAQFDQLKRLLVEYKKVGLRLCLLDEDGYILRQVSSRSKSERVEPGFNEQQKRVLKALERVLEACEREDIRLVGYSDSLVAVPAVLLHTDLASAEARELETGDVYLGADILKS